MYDIILHTLDRKLQDNEFPHQLYVQNYSTKGGASDSCILLKKWIFSRTHEVQASTESVVQNLFYHQVSLFAACAGGAGPYANFVLCAGCDHTGRFYRSWWLLGSYQWCNVASVYSVNPSPAIC